MIKPIHVKEGLRIFKRARRVKRKGFKQYEGNAEEICKKIVKDCWNGTYFQTSNGHFTEFYTRDFGWCIESLLNLGYKKEVEKTLDYALRTFKEHNKITVATSPDNIPFDFPYYASDSVPFLIRSLRLLNNKSLIKEYKEFLNKEIKRYFDLVIDKETGLVRKDKHFSSIKDYAKRISSCYDNTMVAMLNKDLNKLNMLDNPLKKFNHKKLIKENFWTGTHFLDELNGYDFVTGDANTFPFWTGVFNSKKMLKSSIEQIQKNKLDKPFPLRYYHKNIKEHDMIILEIFAKNYERDTIWTHLGPIFTKLVKKIDKQKANKYIHQYKKTIERHKNYLEIFNQDGKPYETFFYHSDESMLWSSMFLDLK